MWSPLLYSTCAFFPTKPTPCSNKHKLYEKFIYLRCAILNINWLVHEVPLLARLRPEYWAGNIIVTKNGVGQIIAGTKVTLSGLKFAQLTQLWLDVIWSASLFCFLCSLTYVLVFPSVKKRPATVNYHIVRCVCVCMSGGEGGVFVCVQACKSACVCVCASCLCSTLIKTKNHKPCPVSRSVFPSFHSGWNSIN